MSNSGKTKKPQQTISLTEREKECLVMSARGLSSKEIGRMLGITISCVNFHVLNTQKKLHATNRTHAVAKAIALKLIPSDCGGGG